MRRRRLPRLWGSGLLNTPEKFPDLEVLAL